MQSFHVVVETDAIDVKSCSTGSLKETTLAIDPGSALLSQFPLIDSALMRSPVKGEIN